MIRTRLKILFFIPFALMLGGCWQTFALRSAGQGSLRLGAAVGSYQIPRSMVQRVAISRAAGLTASSRNANLARLNVKLRGVGNLSATRSGNIIKVIDGAGQRYQLGIKHSGTRTYIYDGNKLIGYSLRAKTSVKGEAKIKYFHLDNNRDLYTGYDHIKKGEIIHYDARGRVLGRSKFKKKQQNDDLAKDIIEEVIDVYLDFESSARPSYERLKWSEVVAKCGTSKSSKKINSIVYLGHAPEISPPVHYSFDQRGKFYISKKQYLGIFSFNTPKSKTPTWYELDAEFANLNGTRILFDSSVLATSTTWSSLFNDNLVDTTVMFQNIDTHEASKHKTKGVLLGYDPFKREAIFSDGKKLFWLNPQGWKTSHSIDFENFGSANNDQAFVPSAVTVNRDDIFVLLSPKYGSPFVVTFDRSSNEIVDVQYPPVSWHIKDHDIKLKCNGKFIEVFGENISSTIGGVLFDINSEKSFDVHSISQSFGTPIVTVSNDFRYSLGREKFNNHVVWDNLTGQSFAKPLEEIIGDDLAMPTSLMGVFFGGGQLSTAEIHNDMIVLFREGKTYFLKIEND